MEHSIAEEFLIPVDINQFPTYYQMIPYPMNLTTIKNRLDNRFYRRVTSIQYDVRFLEKNAKTFNLPGSVIVRRGHILMETILRLIKDIECDDPMPILNDLCKGQVFRSKVGSSTDEDKPSTSRSAARGSHNQRLTDPDLWKKQCDKLLTTIWECNDSGPFRFPVDGSTYPNYRTVIKKPMDLSMIRAGLDSGLYNTPIELQEDFRLMFNNAKTFTPHKRSVIYTMTLRLSAMFEDKFKVITTQWTNQSNRPKRSTRRNTPNTRMTSPWSVPSTSQQSRDLNSTNQTATSSRVTNEDTEGSTSSGSSSETDDDDEDEIVETAKSSKRATSSEAIYATRTGTGTRAVKRYIYSSDEENANPNKRVKLSPSTVNGTGTPGDSTKTLETNNNQQKVDDKPIADNNDDNDDVDNDNDDDNNDNDDADNDDADNDDDNDSTYNSESETDEKLTKSQTKPRKAKSNSNTNNSDSETDEKSRKSRTKRRKAKSTTTSDDSDNFVKSIKEPTTFDKKSRKSRSKRRKIKAPTTSDDSDKSVDEPKKFDKKSRKSRSKRRNVKSTTSDSATESDYETKNKQTKNSKKQAVKGKSRPRRTTRNRGERTVQYKEPGSDNSDKGDNSDKSDNEEKSDNSSEEEVTNVSSRGRVRRLTKRARANDDLFKFNH